MSNNFEVVIVGGGPVGMALAIELGLRGVSCCVIERQLVPQHIPKGQNLTQRTLEHFARWGCANALRAARVLPVGYPIGGVVAYKDLTSSYWHAPPGREAVNDYFSQKNERLPQYATERVLRACAAAISNVTTFFGWSAQSVEQDDNGVQVRIARRYEAGTGELLRAHYVVGCDGARSMVREQMGIDRSGADFGQRMVLVVFRSRELHDYLSRFPERTTYRVLHPELHGYWRFFGRVDVGEGWFFHSPVSGEVTTAAEDIQDVLEQAAGFRFAYELDYVGFWDLRVEVARTYRNSRAFIAGDACHSHPPYGGYGLNAGLEDAVNLGWKIAASLHAWGSDRLLDTYSEERQPIFEETGDDVITAGINRDRDFLNRYSPERDLAEFEERWAADMAVADTGPQWYEPHYEGSSIVIGSNAGHPSVHGEHSDVARPGHHLGSPLLSDGRKVFDALGQDFTLLAFGVDARSVSFMAESARNIGIPLTVIRDTFVSGRMAYGAPLILVRPDQHVAWIGTKAPDDPERLFATVTAMTI